jgi:hypothetical protein
MLAAEQFSDPPNWQFYCTKNCHAYPLPQGLACSEYLISYTLPFLHVQHSTRLYEQLVAALAHQRYSD